MNNMGIFENKLIVRTKPTKLGDRSWMSTPIKIVEVKNGVVYFCHATVGYRAFDDLVHVLSADLCDVDAWVEVDENILAGKLRTKGGIKIGLYPPYCTTAKVVELYEATESRCCIDAKNNYEVKRAVRATIEIRHQDGKTSLGSIEFKHGDVTPKLGEPIYGVAVTCQWGSTQFIMTHIIESPE